MNIDKSKLKIQKIGVEEIPLLVEYRLAYLAELQGYQNEDLNSMLKSDLEIYFRKSMKEGRLFCNLCRVGGKDFKFWRNGD